MKKILMRFLFKKYHPHLVVVWGNEGRLETRMMIASVLRQRYDVMEDPAEYFQQAFWKRYGGFAGLLFPRKKSKPCVAVLACDLPTGQAGPQEDAYHAAKKQMPLRAIVLTPSTDIPGFTDLFSGEESSVARFRKEIARIHPVRSSTSSSFWGLLSGEAALRLKPSLIENPLQTSNGVHQGLVLVLNYDDEAVRSLGETNLPTGRQACLSGRQGRLRQTTYGMNERADLYAGEVKPHAEVDEKNHVLEAGTYAKVHIGGSVVPFHVPHAFGKRHTYAALAALAVAQQFGMNIVEAIEGMRHYIAPQGTGNIFFGLKNSVVVDASSSATPFFVRELLDIAQALRKEHEGLRVVVALGDLIGFGQGDNETQLHKTLGAYIGKAAQELYLVGERVVFTEETAGQEIAAEHIHRYADSGPAAQELERNLKKGDLILIFGNSAYPAGRSGVHMRNVVEQIREKK